MTVIAVINCVCACVILSAEDDNFPRGAGEWGVWCVCVGGGGGYLLLFEFLVLVCQRIHYSRQVWICWVLVLDHSFRVYILKERRYISKSVYVCVCVS